MLPLLLVLLLLMLRALRIEWAPLRLLLHWGVPIPLLLWALRGALPVLLWGGHVTTLCEVLLLLLLLVVVRKVQRWAAQWLLLWALRAALLLWGGRVSTLLWRVRVLMLVMRHRAPP